MNDKAQLERIRRAVDQYRNPPYRSADWLAMEVMVACDTAPANDVGAAREPATAEVERVREAMLEAGEIEAKPAEARAFRHLAKYATDDAIVALSRAAPSSEPAIAEGEREERAFKAGWDKCWCRDPDAPSAVDGGRKAAWDAYAALAQSSTPPASKGETK